MSNVMIRSDGFWKYCTNKKKKKVYDTIHTCEQITFELFGGVFSGCLSCWKENSWKKTSHMPIRSNFPSCDCFWCDQVLLRQYFVAAFFVPCLLRLKSCRSGFKARSAEDLFFAAKKKKCRKQWPALGADRAMQPDILVTATFCPFFWATKSQSSTLSISAPSVPDFTSFYLSNDAAHISFLTSFKQNSGY